MITFPSTAKVGRIMPKEVFYRQLDIKPELKDKFISDVQRITLEYDLTAESIRVDECNKVDEILVLSIQLKRQECDYRIIESIARQNTHLMVFILSYNERTQLALYYRRLYLTDWLPSETVTLETRGLNLETVWNGFVDQIALTDGQHELDDLSIDERLQRQEQIAKLKREIDKLERMTLKEIQPRKKFELYQQLQGLKTVLEGITNGKEKHF